MCAQWPGILHRLNEEPATIPLPSPDVSRRDFNSNHLRRLGAGCGDRDAARTTPEAAGRDRSHQGQLTAGAIKIAAAAGDTEDAGTRRLC